MRVALLSLVAGCGTNAFNSQFGDNDPRRLEKALSRMRASASDATPINSARTPLVVAAVRGPEGRIVAYDVGAGRVLWTQPADVRSRIVIAPDAAVHRDGKDTLVARSLKTGSVRWRAPLPAGSRLLGLAADAGHVVFVTEGEGARVEGREVAAIWALAADSGALRWRVGANGRLGAPALVGGVVLVPFSHQYLSVLDAKNGHEIARVRNRDEEIEFVAPTPEGVFFGSSGLFRLDPAAVRGVAAEATYVRAALPEEFLRASYSGDGYNAAQAQYTAYDRNRLLWRVASDGRGFRDGRVFLHNYRFVFAMDATTGAVQWAYAFPGEDLVASAHLGTDLLLVSARGDVVVLDAATGAPVLSRSLGLAVAGATVDAEGFSAPRTAATPADLHETLTEIIWDPDRRFEQVKLFSIAELSRSRDARVIESLIRIVTHENVDRRVHDRAASTLVERIDPTSVQVLRDALALRTDYLEGTRARGVDALARAAAKLGAPELVPPLIAHLQDAETPAAALPAIVSALVALGDRGAVEPLAQFVLDHRADEGMDAHPEALRGSVDGLLRLGGPSHRQLLSFVGGDAHTRSFLRAYVGEALTAAAPSAASGGVTR